MYHDGGFDDGADVLVVGLGDAGAVTAMTALDDGADVLVVERQAEDARRPNSRFSGGLFLCPTDVDGATHYMNQLVRLNGEVAETDPAVVRAWAEWTSENVDWLTARGGTVIRVADWGEHDHIEGYESISVYKPDMGDHPHGTGHRGWGYGLYEFLHAEVVSRGVRVLHDARAQWLLEDGRGRVIGLRVETSDGVRNLRAGRAVVLTCGGFEFDDQLKVGHLKAFPTRFYGNPENTGDGIRMAMEVGADLWHMNACAARLVGHFPDSGYPGGVPLDIWGMEGMEGVKILYGDFGSGRQEATTVRVADDVAVPVPTGERLPGGIFVNRYGRRFTNELYRTHTLYYEVTDFDSHRLIYPKIPSWWVFDARRMERGPLVPNFYGPTGPLQQVPWSVDNQPEVDRGWVVQASSIPALAERLSMAPDVLSETVAAFNRGCASGADEFDRPTTTLCPVEDAPFFAVRMWPGGPNTQGGARRDPQSRVLRVTGEPIPGLYSAGEFGSVYGMLYPSGGGNIAECIAFGRLAGHEAAAAQ